MLRHGSISTEVESKPFYFTLAALICCLAAAVLIFCLSGGGALAIAAGVMLSVVALAAAATLFAMVTDYACIDNGMLTMRYLFRRKQVPLTEIGKITCKDNVYSVFGKKDKLLGTINGLLSGIDEILYELDKNGVRFE